MPVLSGSMISLFAFGVRMVKDSKYSHFMWLHRPGYFASQQFWFREIPVDKYLKALNLLKFWYIEGISQQVRDILIYQINQDLKQPIWKTRYDWLAIVGHFLGIPFLQNPHTNICSERANYLKYIDRRYDLDKTCPAPNDINNWLKETRGYSVYGKFDPEE